MNKNLKKITVLLHIDEFNKKFDVITELPLLEPEYGKNCTALLTE